MIFAAFVLASVLGLTINDPLTVTPCAANQSMQEFLARTEACWKQIGVAGDDEREIFNPMSKPQPHYIRANVLVHMMDGKIVAIDIPTTGVASQTDVLKDFGSQVRKACPSNPRPTAKSYGRSIHGLASVVEDAELFGVLRQH